MTEEQLECLKDWVRAEIAKEIIDLKAAIAPVSFWDTGEAHYAAESEEILNKAFFGSEV